MHLLGMLIRFSRARIFFLTFLLGFAASGIDTKYFEEVYVDIPQVTSDAPIIVDIYPTARLPMQYGGGGCGGRGEEKAPRKYKKSNR